MTLLLFTQQGALCPSSADTHPLTHNTVVHTRPAPFPSHVGATSKQPACISHHLSPRCSLFHLFFFLRLEPWDSFGEVFIQIAHLQIDTHMRTQTHVNIQALYSLFLYFSLPGSAGSLLHFRKWLRTPFPCSENRCTTNHT